MSKINLTRTTRNRIADLMKPFVGDRNEQQAFVQRVMWGHNAIDRVEYTGSAQTFSSNFMTLLSDEVIDDKPAILVLLEEIHMQVGSDKQEQVNEIIAELRLSSSEPPRKTPTPGNDTSSNSQTTTVSRVSGTNVNIGGTQTIRGNQYINGEE
ncbi:MAG: hypothetical protein AAF787_06475 [Chloroflexota bacterium]